MKTDGYHMKMDGLVTIFFLLLRLKGNFTSLLTRALRAA